MAEQSGTPIIIENGQYWSKNGYAGEDAPRSVFPTLISFHKGPILMGDIEKYVRDYNIGEDALKGQPDQFRLGHSIGPRGILEDYASLEKLWHYTFYTNLRLDPSEHPVILLLDAGWPASEIAKLGEILFETFSVPKFAILTAQFVSVLSARLFPTALVVDIGHTKTTCLPIINNAPLMQYRSYTSVAGKTIDQRILIALEEKNFHEKRVEIMDEILRTIKKDYCYVSTGEENSNPTIKTRMQKEGEEVSLPNNIGLNIGSIPSIAPKILLEGGVLGEISLVDLVAATVANCPQETKIALRKHILLCGGTANIPGLRSALENQLNQREDFESKGKYQVYCPDKPEFSNWRGGSIAGSQKLLQGLYTSREQYKQDGPGIIIFADSHIASHFKGD